MYTSEKIWQQLVVMELLFLFLFIIRIYIASSIFVKNIFLQCFQEIRDLTRLSLFIHEKYIYVYIHIYIFIFNFSVRHVEKSLPRIFVLVTLKATRRRQFTDMCSKNNIIYILFQMQLLLYRHRTIINITFKGLVSLGRSEITWSLGLT